MSLSDYAGSTWCCTYPAAMTPDVRRRPATSAILEALSGAGVKVVGISPDKTGEAREIPGTRRFDLPLLSDPDHQILEAWRRLGREEPLRQEVHRGH